MIVITRVSLAIKCNSYCKDASMYVTSISDIFARNSLMFRLVFCSRLIKYDNAPPKFPGYRRLTVSIHRAGSWRGSKLFAAIHSIYRPKLAKSPSCSPGILSSPIGAMTSLIPQQLSRTRLSDVTNKVDRSMTRHARPREWMVFRPVAICTMYPQMVFSGTMVGLWWW